MSDHPDDWRAAGACATADPELFFPLTTAGPALAQAERACRICATCQVIQPCLEFALEHAEVDGVWGGTTAEERRRARRARAALPRPRRPVRPASRVG